MSLFHLYDVYWKQKAFIRAQVAGRVLNSGFLSMKRLGVHCRVTPSTFAGTHLNTWARLFKTAISANPRLNRLIAD